MASVVDALVMEYKLDSSQFASNADEANRMFDYLQGMLTKKGMDLEGTAKSIGFAVGRIQNGIAGIFGVTLSFQGFKSLMLDAAESTSKTGHLANIIGISTQKLSVWEQAAVGAGAQPGEMAGTLAKMRLDIVEYLVNYKRPRTPWMMVMASAGVPWETIINPDPTVSMLAFSEALEIKRVRDHWTDQQLRTYVESLTSSIFMQDLILSGPANMRRVFGEMAAAGGGGVTSGQAEAGADARKLLFRLRYSLMHLVNEAFVTLDKFINKLLNLYKTLSPFHISIKSLFVNFGKFIDRILEQIAKFWNKIKSCETGDIGAGTSLFEGGGGGGGAGPGGHRAGHVPGRGADVEHGAEAETGTKEAGGNVPTSTDTSLVGNEYLQSERKRFADELAANPNRKLELAATIDMEYGEYPTEVAESLMNRMAMTGGSLHSGIHSGFYGPVNRGHLAGRMAYLRNHPNELNKLYAGIDKALAGSNILEGATDQGSPGDPNASWAGGRKFIGPAREIFNDWGGGPGGHAGAREFRERQQQRVRASRSGPVEQMLRRPNSFGRENSFLTAPPSFPKAPGIEDYLSNFPPAPSAGTSAVQEQSKHIQVDDNTETNVSEIHVHTQATSAEDITRDIHKEIHKFRPLAHRHTSTSHIPDFKGSGFGGGSPAQSDSSDSGTSNRLKMLRGEITKEEMLKREGSVPSGEGGGGNTDKGTNELPEIVVTPADK